MRGDKIPHNRRPDHRAAVIDRARRIKASGGSVTTSVIAERLGINQSTAQAALAHAGWIPVGKHHSAEWHPPATNTQEHAS